MSAFIVALIAAGTASGLIATANETADQRMHSQAAQLARQDQERLRGFSAQQLAGLNQSRNITLGTTQFTVTSTAQYLNSSGGSSCTSNGSGAAAYFQTASTVNWAGNLRSPVTIESVVTPPAGGTLLANVQDQTAQPLAGLAVAASGPDYGAATTGSAGCVVLAGLQPGSYNVSVTAAGYIDPNGNSSPPNLTATLSGNGTSVPSVNPVMMGLAGNLNANFTTKATGNTVSCPPSNGVCTSQLSDALSYFGNGSSTNMSIYKSSTLSSPGSQVPSAGMIQLFPFWFTSGSYNNNYQLWTGSCQQMQPPSNVDMFTVAPGSSQTATVSEPALNVVVKNNNVRVAPGRVKLTFQSGSGPSCSDNWYAPIASDASIDANGSLAYPGEPFATTATSGPTASASGYTGTYTVCADYGGHYQTVSSVQNNNYAAPTSVTVNINSSSSPSGTC